MRFLVANLLQLEFVVERILKIVTYLPKTRTCIFILRKVARSSARHSWSLHLFDAAMTKT